MNNLIESMENQKIKEELTKKLNGLRNFYKDI